MTYSEALVFLGKARRFGMKLGLQNMQDLSAALGHPERNLRFIHIAGTNGKGSTAAFCSAILQAAGFRVGLYTSPHLVYFGERIQVNGQSISSREIAEGIEAIRSHAQRAGIDETVPTFFEWTTALALWHFSRNKVDYVIWETGLGGRLDATNIVTPEISIITSIGFDHQQYLGEKIAQIAGEKAGIIKPGIPVITAESQEEALSVIRARACELETPFTVIGSDWPVRDRGNDSWMQKADLNGTHFHLNLLGTHQILNAGCAVAAIQKIIPAIPESAVRKGLISAVWPGRFQVWRREPLLVLDGAHNPPALERILETWRAVQGDKPFHLVWGVLGDKDYKAMAQQLQPVVKSIDLVKVQNERALDPNLLKEYFPGKTVAVYSSLEQALPGILQRNEPVLITGSLFMAGDFLRLQSKDQAGEPELNELLSPKHP